MRKTDKKIDNSLREALTAACEVALVKYEGFEWLTHFANYQNFPGSLSVVCVFDRNVHLSQSNLEGLSSIIKDKLASIDIDIKDIGQHVSFDTEENCEKENNGKWRERFK